MSSIAARVTNKMFKVFVYGTLKRGQPNHKEHLQNPNKGISKFISVGMLQQKYPLVSASDYFIPFLLDVPGTGKNVIGEVYEVDEGMFEALDALEGFPDFYTRRKETVKYLEKEEEIQDLCWVYFLFSFKPELLSLNHLQNWDVDAEGNRYVPRAQRDKARPVMPMVKQQSKITYKVFVYGTLKRGQPNHNFLQDEQKGIAKYLGSGQTQTSYPLVIASKFNIPYLLDAPGSGKKVMGEIYEVDESILKHLDILEEYPRLYTRREEEVVVPGSSGEASIVKCWIYLLHSFKPELADLPKLENWTQDNELGLPYISISQREGPKSAYSHVKEN